MKLFQWILLTEAKKKTLFSDKLLNHKLPYALHDYIGEQLQVKKNEKLSMNNFLNNLRTVRFLSNLLTFLSLLGTFSLIAFSISLLFGCTAMDPIGDKNVAYTFENVSYESPNSSPHDNIGEMEGKFNFDKKLPVP